MEGALHYARYDPGYAIRWLYEQWVLAGGKALGKPRHTMAMLQGAIANPAHRLSGRILLDRTDTELLLRRLFTTWQFDAVKRRNVPIASDEDIERSIRLLLDDLYLEERKLRVAKDRARRSRGLGEFVVEKLDRQSRMPVYLVPSPRASDGCGVGDTARFLYKLHMCLLRNTQKDRPIVWVLDYGLWEYREMFGDYQKVFDWGNYSWLMLVRAAIERVYIESEHNQEIARQLRRSYFLVENLPGAESGFKEDVLATSMLEILLRKAGLFNSNFGEGYPSIAILDATEDHNSWDVYALVTDTSNALTPDEDDEKVEWSIVGKSLQGRWGQFWDGVVAARATFDKVAHAIQLRHAPAKQNLHDLKGYVLLDSAAFISTEVYMQPARKASKKGTP